MADSDLMMNGLTGIDVAWDHGWHAFEQDAGAPFRWMGARAGLRFAAGGGPRYLELTARSPFTDLRQRLSVRAEGHDDDDAIDLVYGWNVVSVEIPAAATGALLHVDPLLPVEGHPGDARELAVQLRPPQLHADSRRHAETLRVHATRVVDTERFLASDLVKTARSLQYHGFYAAETGDRETFRWMGARGRLTFPAEPRARFLDLWVRSVFDDDSQSLRLVTDAGTTTTKLLPGWNALSVPVEAGASEVRLHPSRLSPRARHPEDERDLSLQVRAPVLHPDAARHGHLLRQQANRVLNFDEVARGADVLQSLPPKLGIDITGACNVKPPCVYCDWDVAKDREGENVDLPFNATTLVEYGRFFENADELVNCSIGEPFMVRSIDALLDAFGARGKLLELTTNGQILTDTNIEKLLGRDVHLYVSLDAATPATYARLRNDTLPKILDNLQRLVSAKGGPGRLPLLYLVFMPMRANVHEVDAFVDLCARLRVDRLVLRPLNPSPGVALRWDRAGYHYDYRTEILPFDDLVRISGRVARLCERAGVALSDQLDFGGNMSEEFAATFAAGRREADGIALSPPPASPFSPPPMPVAPEAPPVAEDWIAATDADEPAPEEPPRASRGLPVCTEPWTSLYVLRRGTLPCCYGGGPIAPMSGFKEAWNGPLMTDIRRSLAAGRFHRYCFDSPDCPIVRRRAHSGDLPIVQKLQLASRRGMSRVKQAGAPVLARLRQLRARR